MRPGLLLARDLRRITRDPLLLLFPLVPALMGLAARLGLPPLAALLLRLADFGLEPWLPLVATALVLAPASFAGFVSGFLLLEDREARTVAHLRTTPAGGSGYLLLRLGPPVLYAAAWGLALPPLAGLGGLLPDAPALAAVAALEAPLYALALGAFAADQMEGLALAKLLGLLGMAPFALLAPGTLRGLALVLPPVWLAEAARAGAAAPGGAGFPAGPSPALEALGLSSGPAMLAAALLVHAIAGLALVRAFLRRAE